ncbi:MAG: response regulator transcription factor [Bacteroidota bacterium]|nr:response regulator transcription factor [Bacteroidota bacterium]
MQEFTIHIIEDELILANTLKLNLELEHYKTIVSSSGNKAIEDFEKNKSHIHLVLLDVMLPDLSGFEICKIIKEKSPNTPVIFLTAKNQTINKIEGLKLGADDYITKPFDLEELLLRISNLIKRTQKQFDSVIKFNGCEINFETYEILDITGVRRDISKREIGLLQLLSQNVNKVISRDEIIEKLWDVNENASSRTIDNYILNFRKWFEINPKEPVFFQSIRGVGYKFIKE